MDNRLTLQLGLRMALAAPLLFGSGADADAPGKYTIVDLTQNAGGGDSGYGRAINAAGSVAGKHYRYGSANGYLWSDGGATLISIAEGLGINSYDHVAGAGDIAWLYRDGEIEFLGVLGDGWYSGANDVNDSDQVVGWTNASGPSGKMAFIWEDGVMSPLGELLGFDYSVAMAINNAGTVVGWNTSGLDLTPVVWTASGPTALDNPVGRDAVARDINEEGVIVGYAEDSDGHETAVRWDSEGITYLGTLETGWWSEAYGVNASGDVVGISSHETSFTAALYQGGAWYNLDDYLPPGSDFESLTLAYAINDSREIVGTGTTVYYETHAFKLVPVPDGRVVLVGPNPGWAGYENSFTVSDATPGATVTFAYALAAGSASVPGCSGLSAELRAPTVMGTATADEDGVAVLTLFIPPAAIGRTIYFQAGELASCRVSNLIEWKFP